jgi:hypothetical protein
MANQYLYILYEVRLLEAQRTTTEGALLIEAEEGGLALGWNRLTRILGAASNLLIPGLLRQFFRLLFTSDQLFKAAIRRQVDTFASVAVMFSLALGTLFTVLFAIFQLHGF